jgi:hypothetical protein
MSRCGLGEALAESASLTRMVLNGQRFSKQKMPLRKPAPKGGFHFLPRELTRLICTEIHAPLALETNQATCILIDIVMLYLQDKELFTREISLAGTALTTQGNIEIDRGILLCLHDRARSA